MLCQDSDITPVSALLNLREEELKCNGRYGIARSMADYEKTIGRWSVKCLSFASVGNITHRIKTVALGRPHSWEIGVGEECCTFQGQT